MFRIGSTVGNECHYDKDDNLCRHPVLAFYEDTGNNRSSLDELEKSLASGYSLEYDCEAYNLEPWQWREVLQTLIGELREEAAP